MNGALTPDEILRDPDPDIDDLTSAIARHSDWLPQAEYQVRGLMLADQGIERQIEKAGEQLATIIDLYKAKIEALHSHQNYFRRGIEAYIRIVNDGKKVAWPDVGTAYLAQRKEKIEITNESEALAVLKQEGMKEAIKAVEKIIKKEFDACYNAKPSAFKGCVKVLPEHTELNIRRAS